MEESGRIAKIASEMEINTVYQLPQFCGQNLEFVIRGPKIFDNAEKGQVVVTPVEFAPGIGKWRVKVSNLLLTVPSTEIVVSVSDGKNLA